MLDGARKIYGDFTEDAVFVGLAETVFWVSVGEPLMLISVLISPVGFRCYLRKVKISIEALVNILCKEKLISEG